MGFKELELRQTADQNGKLEALEIGFTSRCNFNCDYCGAYNREDQKSLLTGRQVIELIQGLPDLKRVRLSGGEVTLFLNECLEVIEFCSSNGIETQVNTNGSMLDSSKIKVLEHGGLNYLHFSFNHISSRAHDRYYRKGESTFDRIVDNIKYTASKSGIEAITETLIYDETMAHIPELYELIHDMGVRKLQIQTPVRQKKWDSLVPTDRIVAAIEILLTIKKPDSEYYFTCLKVDPAGKFYKKNEALINRNGIYFPSCVEGVSQLHLHSNGDVLVCDIGKPVLLGNVFNGTSLETIMLDKSQELEILNSHCDCTTYL